MSANEPDINLQYQAEIQAQRRFNGGDLWSASEFAARFRRSIPAGMAAFIQDLPCFFIATANSHGACDCSLRGRDYNAAGRPEILVKVVDSMTLIFPDYRGNNYFNSLGNILDNGQIGMLFVDFETQRRVRINGRAKIIEDRQAYIDVWPCAQRYVQVSVEQVFGNCRSRIPRMQLVMPTDSDLQDG